MSVEVSRKEFVVLKTFGGRNTIMCAEDTENSVLRWFIWKIYEIMSESSPQASSLPAVDCDKCGMGTEFYILSFPPGLS